MSAAEWSALLPFGVLAGAALLVLLASAFIRKLWVALVLTLAATAAALGLLIAADARALSAAGSLISLDPFVRFGVGLILVATLFTAVSSWSVLRRRGNETGDFFFLLLVASLGACTLAASSAFATFFLGLELLSVSLYALIGWRREQGIGTEAAIKYLVLAGVTSAFVFFGMALLYAATGSMDLFRIVEQANGGGVLPALGLGILLVGVGFKLAVVPFHMWTPDVYDGAPSPVSGYIASVSKGAMVVVLARALAPALTGASPVSRVFPWILAAIAGVSMFGGNLLALRESNVKRILAYSSIAHLGYLLVAFLAAGPEAMRAIAFYLVAYFASTLGAFAAVGELGSVDRDATEIEDYRGLAVTRPGVATVLTAMVMSLAGLPLTVGFIGKFLILRAGEGAAMWTLAVLLVVNSTISIFYYLRIVSTLFRGFTVGHAGGHAQEPPAERPGASIVASPVPLFAGLALALLTLVVVVLGVYPSPLISFITGFSASGP